MYASAAPRTGVSINGQKIDNAKYAIHLHSIRSWSSWLQPFEKSRKNFKSLSLHSIHVARCHPKNPAWALTSLGFTKLPSSKMMRDQQSPCMLYAFFRTLYVIPAFKPFFQFLLICVLFKAGKIGYEERPRSAGPPSPLQTLAWGKTYVVVEEHTSFSVATNSHVGVPGAGGDTEAVQRHKFSIK